MLLNIQIYEAIPWTDPRDNLLDSLLVGEGGSNVEPASDPTLYGHVTLEGQTEGIEARSYQTFRLTYTVGRYGLDDTGAIRIAFRAMSDFGRLQMADPTAAGYTTGHGQQWLPFGFDL